MINTTLTHKHCKGLTIKILAETKKGYKVEQTELYQSWDDKKLRKPKVKQAYFSNAEIKDLFTS